MKSSTLIPNQKTGRAGILAQAGALASAVIASACCWLPLLLIAVGVSGGALSAAFEAWRPVFLPLTFVLLGFAFHFTYRKPKVPAAASAGSPASGECAVPEQGTAEACCPPVNAQGVTLNKINKVMLWVVTVLVLAFAFFPNYVGWLLNGKEALAARSDLDKIVVKIDGMTCEACAVSIGKALRRVPGVVTAEVSYEGGEAVIGVAKDSELPREAVLAAIAGAGNYRGTFTDSVLWTLTIEGMTCEGCATGLQAALAGVPGVSSASVSYAEGIARISAGAGVSEETLRRAVSEVGYTVTSAASDKGAAGSGDPR